MSRLGQNAADAACVAIVAQIVSAVEAAKDANGLTGADLAKRSGLSRRTVVYLRKLAVLPSLRSLLAFVDSAGLELVISVRRRRMNNGQLVDASEGVHDVR